MQPKLLFNNILVFGRFCNGRYLFKNVDDFSKSHPVNKLMQIHIRTFINRNVKQKSNASNVYGNSRFQKLLKPFCFTAGFTVVCYGGAALCQYELMRKRAWKLYSEQTDWWLNREKAGHYRQIFNGYWNAMNEGQRIAAGLIFLNCLVFLAWRIPSLEAKMLKYFVCEPTKKSVLPMLLSTFSHASLTHLVLNMYVLFSFSSAVGHVLGKEQFIATYLSAGVISSFASLLCKVVTSKNNPSLGASGAILGILAFTCCEYPDSRLSIVFLPFFTFTAGNALAAILALDSAGILFGWKLFDHAAHLGGSLFGIWYSIYGKRAIWENRSTIMTKWHEFRNAKS